MTWSIITKCFNFLKNNKIIILLLLCVICAVLFIRNRSGLVLPKHPTVSEIFIQSNKFIGEKKGYVFKTDTKGLGYYVDKYTTLQ